MDLAMTRKHSVTEDPTTRQVVETQASIQYLRTGRRRRAPRTVDGVQGVRSVFA
jgi:hypothetical protein